MNPAEPSIDSLAPNPASEEVIDPALPAGAHQIVVIRRHPFGLIALFFETIIGLGISFGLIFFLLPSLLNNSSSSVSNVRNDLAIVAVIVVALSAIFLLIAAALYRQNRWIVSDDSITQVLRVGVFRFQTSGLSMANVEDVTAEKTGLFAAIFNFGVLKAETAGAQPNFHFFYCPKPEMYAKILLDARERFIESDPEKAERANELLNVPRH